MEKLNSEEHINNCIDQWKKCDDIFLLFNLLSQKKNNKNQKTNQRRNQLRQENGKKIKRWSKWRTHGNYKINDMYLNDISQLKNSLDLKLEKLIETWNIIGLFKLYGVELKESRKLYRWLCPFHQENTPSFTVSKTKLVAKCFGCGKSYFLLTMLFILKFWEEVTRKKWRFELLEKDIDMFMDLEPIVKFNVSDDSNLENVVIKSNNNEVEEDLSSDLPF